MLVKCSIALRITACEDCEFLKKEHVLAQLDAVTAEFPVVMKACWWYLKMRWHLLQWGNVVNLRELHQKGARDGRALAVQSVLCQKDRLQDRALAVHLVLQLKVCLHDRALAVHLVLQRKARLHSRALQVWMVAFHQVSKVVLRRDLHP